MGPSKGQDKDAALSLRLFVADLVTAAIHGTLDHRKRQDTATIRSKSRDIVAMKDYLGKAAEIGREVTAAVEAGEHDVAWRLLHEQQALFLKHARHFNFSHFDTLTILSGVHWNFAKILRKEEKHKDALIHVIYMVASDRRRLKRHQHSLRAYFNRCKFMNTTVDELLAYSEEIWSRPEFPAVRCQVQQWAARD